MPRINWVEIAVCLGQQLGGPLWRRSRDLIEAYISLIPLAYKPFFFHIYGDTYQSNQPADIGLCQHVCSPV